jgi:hypothetical protein
MKKDMTDLRVRPELKNVDGLPGAEAHSVAKPGRVFRREALEELAEVAAYVGIGIFLFCSMVKNADVRRMKTVSNPFWIRCATPRPDIPRDVVNLSPGREQHSNAEFVAPD